MRRRGFPDGHQRLPQAFAEARVSPGELPVLELQRRGQRRRRRPGLLAAPGEDVDGGEAHAPAPVAESPGGELPGALGRQLAEGHQRGHADVRVVVEELLFQDRRGRAPQPPQDGDERHAFRAGGPFEPGDQRRQDARVPLCHLDESLTGRAAPLVVVGGQLPDVDLEPVVQRLAGIPGRPDGQRQVAAGGDRDRPQADHDDEMDASHWLPRSDGATPWPIRGNPERGVLRASRPLPGWRPGGEPVSVYSDQTQAPAGARRRAG